MFLRVDMESKSLTSQKILWKAQQQKKKKSHIWENNFLHKNISRLGTTSALQAADAQKLNIFAADAYTGPKD